MQFISLGIKFWFGTRKSSIDDWLEPFTVLGVNAEKKLVYVKETNVGAVGQMNVVQPVDIAHYFFIPIVQALSRFYSTEDEDEGV